MPKQVYISIDTPCHEDWNAMTPTAQGAYCKSCNKQVIDFTRKTENEIYDIVTQSGTNLCGRFTQFQLEQPVRKTEIKNGILNWRAIAASLATLATVADIKEAKAQIVLKEAPALCPVKTPFDTADHRIQGIVIDEETKEPLIGATVWLKNAKLGVATDEAGKFCFNLNVAEHRNDIIEIRYLAHDTQSFAVAGLNTQIASYIQLKPVPIYDLLAVGGVSVRPHRICKKKKR